LNRYPRLRFVLHNQLNSYENVEVQWVPGATPTAHFYAADDSEIDKVELGDRSFEELLQLFSTHGFTPSRPVVTYPSEPTATATFGGHYYEIFSTPNYFSDSNDFARARTRNDVHGHLLTVTSPEENAFVLGLLSSHGIDKVWLGGQDVDEDEWKWIDGKEERGKVFWKGNHGGSVVDDAFVNWREGEPNNVDDEDCALFYGMDGKWNDGTCTTEKASLVIEFSDETAALSEPTTKTDL